MISKQTKELAKKRKIPLTYMKGGKRYKKTEKMLSRQINKKGGRYNAHKDKEAQRLNKMLLKCSDKACSEITTRKKMKKIEDKCQKVYKKNKNLDMKQKCFKKEGYNDIAEKYFECSQKNCKKEHDEVFDYFSKMFSKILKKKSK
jgi:hypothetical protein